MNVATKKKTALKLPDDHLVIDWSRDGKYFLTTCVAGGPDKPEAMSARQHLMNRDGTEHKALNDGKKLASSAGSRPTARGSLPVTPQPDKDKREPPYRELVVLDVATGKVSKVADVPLNAEVQGFCWSPDGKKIAYTWRKSTRASRRR